MGEGGLQLTRLTNVRSASESCESRTSSVLQGCALRNRPIIDVFIYYSERKIMSHVADSDLHYKMCFGPAEGVAEGGGPRATCEGGCSEQSHGECLPCRAPLSSWTGKKRGGGGKMVPPLVFSSSLRPPFLSCLEPFITVIQISSRKSYFGFLSSLHWLLSCFTVKG